MRGRHDPAYGDLSFGFKARDSAQTLGEDFEMLVGSSDPTEFLAQVIVAVDQERNPL